MVRSKFLFIPVSLIFLLIFSISACTNSDAVVQSGEVSSDYEALVKLAQEDEVIQSFEPNYNEEEAMSLLGSSLRKEIYPVRVGQRMRLVDTDLQVDFVGDTAIGILTKTFEGKLFIAANYEEFDPAEIEYPVHEFVDTLIEKEFTTVITSKIKYAKFENTRFPERNWKVIAVSLPEGGTGSSDIVIKKMTLFLPNEEVVEILNPNDYFLERIPGWRRQVPVLNRNEEVTVRIELESTYADSDFVSLTYGAIIGGPHHRVKKRFELVSEEELGGIFIRTYEQSWIIRQVPGFKHAIINAIPRSVLFDDESQVEEHSWGMPYSVR